MAGETKRKVIRFKSGSGMIAIPPDFRRYHNLDGTMVKVLYDSLMLIIPADAEKKLREREKLVRRLLE